MIILLDIDGVMVAGNSWKKPEFLSDGFPAFSKNETFAFAIITNNGTRKNDNSSVIDAVATQFTQN